MKWILHIDGVNISASFPCQVQVSLSPTDHALLTRGIITESELADSYRQAITRGSYPHYKVIG